jgi:hypothetical protein
MSKSFGNEMRIKMRLFAPCVVANPLDSTAIAAVRALSGTKTHYLYLRIPLPSDPLVEPATAATDAVTARAEEDQRHRRHQKHALQFQCPSTGFAE